MRYYPTLTLAVSLCTMLPHAKADNWACPRSGDYFDLSNWQDCFCNTCSECCPGGADELPDSASFGQPATYTVSFSGDDWVCNSGVNDGNVTFDLNGHTFTADGCSFPLTVGTSEEATLTITDGTVTGASVWMGGRGSTGIVNVQDDGNLFTTRANVGNDTFGTSGDGELNVLPGGHLALSVGLRVGDVDGASGEVNLRNGGVSTAGRVTVASGGNGGTAEMRIIEGSRLESEGANVGEMSGSYGEVLISGSGAVWEITGDWPPVKIGCRDRDCSESAGTGIITLESGGQLIVPNVDVQVGPKGTIGGSGTFVGSYVMYGELSPGNSIGTTVIDGSYAQQSNGTLNIEISDTDADLVAVTGNATLRGALDVSLFGDQLPAVGDRFEILTASSVSGTFSEVSTPDEFDLDVEYGADNVTLEITGVNPPPTLDVSPDPLIAGQDGTFSATSLTPNEMSYLAYSVKGAGSTFVPPLNVTIDLERPKQAGNALMTDGNGDVEWSLRIPPLNNPVPIWFQAVQFENKSNVVATSIQP